VIALRREQPALRTPRSVADASSRQYCIGHETISWTRKKSPQVCGSIAHMHTFDAEGAVSDYPNRTVRFCVTFSARHIRAPVKLVFRDSRACLKTS
jgi:hypothetical protein